MEDQLVADGRYDYIETGSLISIRKNVKDIVIPSEEEKISLHPMDYEEFKWALGDTTTITQLRMLFDRKMSIGDAVTRKLMRDFRTYMVVGGMPQALLLYIPNRDWQAQLRDRLPPLSWQQGLPYRGEVIWLQAPCLARCFLPEILQQSAPAIPHLYQGFAEG